jgi:SLIT-ROBO Rho GTPase activating protein
VLKRKENRYSLYLKFSLIRRPIKPKQIGRAPILGRPRLFGGKLLDYIQVTQQHIPLIISSCVSAINRLGLHNQVSKKTFN